MKHHTFGRGIAALALVAGSLTYASVSDAATCSDDSGRTGACQYAIDYEGNVSVYVGLPACPFEDGKPNGEPCIWTSPDTAMAYYVDSSEYRS